MHMNIHSYSSISFPPITADNFPKSERLSYIQYRVLTSFETNFVNTFDAYANKEKIVEMKT